MNYFKDLSPNVDSFLFVRIFLTEKIFKREFCIQFYEENSRRRTMNTTNDTVMFVMGMMFTLTIVMCLKTKKVTDEAMKVLRERK